MNPVIREMFDGLCAFLERVGMMARFTGQLLVLMPSSLLRAERPT